MVSQSCLHMYFGDQLNILHLFHHLNQFLCLVFKRMGWWTVFYMAWWVAWACFVGLFIARISKNRTLRSVIIGVFIAPTAYALVWFSFMGGIGLRQQRQALELEVLGESLYGDPNHYAESDVCYNVPQEDVYDADGNLVFSNTLLGITPVCKLPSNSALAWFNVMYSFSYPNTGPDGNCK